MGIPVTTIELLSFGGFDQIAALPGYRPDNPLCQDNYHKILGWYRFPEKRMCCVQRPGGTLCGTPHNHGWVAELKDGSVTILGADCANDKFGADSTVFKDIGLALNAKRERERQQRLEHLLGQGVEYEQRLRDEIARLKTARRGIDDLLDSVGANFRSRIERMAKSGNASVVVEGVKTRCYKENGKSKQESSVINHVVGALDGMAAIDRQQFFSLTVEMEHIKVAFINAKAAGSLSRTVRSEIARRIEQCDPALMRAQQLEIMVARFLNNSAWPYCFLTDDRSERSKVAKLAMKHSGVEGSCEYAKTWLLLREAELCQQLGVERIRICR
jgi:hypothetical protein